MNSHPMNAGQFRSLLGVVREMSALTETQDFFNHTARAVAPLMPHTHLAVEAYDLGAMRQLGGSIPTLDSEGEKRLEVYLAHVHEHPAWQHVRSFKKRMEVGETYRFTTRDAFHRTVVYNEFFKPIAAPNQLWIGVNLGASCVLTFSYSRDGDFSDAERAAMNLLMPHFAQAWRTWNALRDAAGRNRWVLDALDRLQTGLIDLDLRGRIRRWTKGAEAMLSRHFPAARRPPGRLPRAVQSWARRNLAAARGEALPPPPFEVRSPEGGMIIRFTASPSDAGGGLLVLEPLCDTPRPEALAHRFGLPPQRARVLHLLAQGCSNAQIAEALNIRPRTVGKHLEHLYTTLGVSTRHAAATKALQAFAGQGPPPQ